MFVSTDKLDRLGKNLLKMKQVIVFDDCFNDRYLLQQMLSTGAKVKSLPEIVVLQPRTSTAFDVFDREAGMYDPDPIHPVKNVHCAANEAGFFSYFPEKNIDFKKPEKENPNFNFITHTYN